MNVRLKMYKYCYLNLCTVSAKGPYLTSGGCFSMENAEKIHVYDC